MSGTMWALTLMSIATGYFLGNGLVDTLNYRHCLQPRLLIGLAFGAIDIIAARWLM